MFRQIHRCFTVIRQFSIAAEKHTRICVIGSGPAGWYTSRMLITLNEKVSIDMYEKLPVPFGLVRYGVAPDHPEVKNVEKEFTKHARHPRFRYIGNVNVGIDVSVADLQKAYHAVVFAYGSPSDRRLGIPGEEHVISTPAVVGWYNGDPEYRNLKFDLDCEEVAIIGQGNVALDISRLLLRNIDDLRKTDITERALEDLSKSRVKRVTCIGRRGPLQTAFTTAEVREMVELPGFDVVLRAEDIDPIVLLIPCDIFIFFFVVVVVLALQRPKKRLMQLLAETAAIAPTCDKQWCVEFLRSPLEVTKSGNMLSVKLGINKLEGKGAIAVPKATGQTEMRDFGMIIRSVGYSAEQIDSLVPIDIKGGKIPNTMGRVNGNPGLYCSGWIQGGPIGVLITTRNGCYDTAQIVNQDITEKVLPVNEKRPGFDLIERILKEKGIQIVSFDDWEKINAIEVSRGAKSYNNSYMIVSILIRKK
uniref:NADPH:adrenodoxin oxidoreductase, mitochondrial n=1 Tax=Strigamia maritima TaxID=126957 RepID=T1IHX0_STRMM